jgi:hypothetical protein
MKPTAHSQRRRLPTEEGIDLAMQFATFLQMAHQQRIVYLDHKLEHVYWDGQTLHHRSEQFETGRNRHAHTRSISGKKMHNLCVWILYPIFTGQSPQKGTLMPQPASQNEVEQRYAHVNALDFSAEPDLSASLQNLLQRGARQELNTIRDFLTGLERVAARHGWDLPPGPTVPALREARDRVQFGLSKLRQGQEAIREARESLLEAVILDDINEDMEAELRRLLALINQVLNNRVIP